MVEPFLIAKGERDLQIVPRMANRHGLIAGATGTGKTVTLQVMAETFSRAGVPVFVADIKGDLSGISEAGTEKPRIMERIKLLGLENFTFDPSPAIFWDVFGEQGHPLRATVSEMGPLLLSRLLDLNETQAGVLTLAFKIADDNGLLLLDLKDLRALLQHVGDNAKEFTTEYGNVSATSVGAIQRSLLTLDEQGGELLFGEPALELRDLMRTDTSGRGIVNVLAADKLINSPKVYATFLLWMLSELFEALPEVGDLDKPKLVFFFDEAHLLFNEAPTALLEKIEQVVRLIRSKGVGIYFITQNPLDIPEMVLGQLGNRVQHALRAFTPRDQRAVRSAAETFRANPKLDITTVITELGVGEALVSFLDDRGTPGIVERAFILPPHGQIGPITPDQRTRALHSSPVAGRYDKTIDRESAYELLKERAADIAREAEEALEKQERSSTRTTGRAANDDRDTPARRSRRQESAPTNMLESFARGALRSLGTTVGREIARGLFGTLLGGSRRR